MAALALFRVLALPDTAALLCNIRPAHLVSLRRRAIPHRCFLIDFGEL
jgi:hypothetical protein